MTSVRSDDAGFSLIEVIISLSIFALLGIAGFGLVQNMLRTERLTEDGANAYSSLDRTFLIIGDSLRNATPETIVLENGELSFTLADGLRHVQASLVGGETRLLRSIGDPSDYLTQTLATELSAQFAILDAAGSAHPSWPATGASQPVLISMTLTNARWATPQSRVFPFPGAF